VNIGQAVIEALESLLANKLRPGLTILGIVIGVAAVIAMLAVGTGAQNSISIPLMVLAPTYCLWRQVASNGRKIPRSSVSNR